MDFENSFVRVELWVEAARTYKIVQTPRLAIFIPDALIMVASGASYALQRFRSVYIQKLVKVTAR
jgi:hypothetical protein